MADPKPARSDTIDEALEFVALRLAEAGMLFAEINARVARLEGRSAYDLGGLDQKAVDRRAEFLEMRASLGVDAADPAPTPDREETSTKNDVAADRTAAAIAAIFGKDEPT